MPATFDLVAVGLTTLDVTLHPVDELPGPDEGRLVDTIRLSPAGTAAGTALVAARLGLSAAVVSAVGNDAQGVVVRSLLEAEGVDTSCIDTFGPAPTSTTVLPVRSDGTRPNFHMIGASVLAGLPHGAWDMARRTRAVHWGGVGFPGLASGGAEFLEAARGAGAFVTCDLIAPTEAARSDLVRLLPHVDLFMPSMAEVRFLAGTDDPDAAAAFFMGLGAGGCLFKMGPQGALLIGRDARIGVPAYDIVPVDTTSCGDSFCAGFHVGRARGLSNEAAMRFAAATAALVAQGVGTTGALVDQATTEAFARTAAVRTETAI